MACLDGLPVAFEDFLGKAAAEFTKAVGILLPCAPCGDGGAHYLVDGLASATRFEDKGLQPLVFDYDPEGP
jgi:hypothetical protein